MRLNLDAKTKAQQLVKEYLENNVSSALAEKINKGTVIEKDGKTLKNKKTLDGFMKYASDEARKLAERGANSACVEDKVVYGWAVHYFEEDSIEGTLFNEFQQDVVGHHQKGFPGKTRSRTAVYLYQPLQGMRMQPGACHALGRARVR